MKRRETEGLLERVKSDLRRILAAKARRCDVIIERGELGKLPGASMDKYAVASALKTLEDMDR